MAKQEVAVDSVEIAAAELKRQRKEAKKAATAATEQAVVAVDESEAKRLRKAARQAAREADSIETCGQAEVKSSDGTVELDEVEAKRQRKAAKKAAELSAVSAEVAVGSGAQDQDEAEAKRIRKAAKKAAKEAAASSQEGSKEAAAWEWFTQVADEAEAKRKRKAAKAFKEVSAADVEAQPETPKRKATKQAVEDTEAAKEEGHPAKRSKKVVAEGDFTACIRSLPWSASQDALERDFAECGEIESVNMPKGEDGKPRGLAFVKFLTQEALEAALKFNDTQYGGRTIYVEKAGEKTKGQGNDGDGKQNENGGRNNPLTVCIKCLPYSFEEAVVKKDFGECGEIVKMNLLKDEEGQSRGMCFVTFKTQEGLDAAMKFHETEYGGRTILVAKPLVRGGGGKGAGRNDKWVEDKDVEGEKGKGKGKDGKSKGEDSEGKGKDGKGKGKGKSKKGKPSKPKRTAKVAIIRG